jgi:hypothetical protein
MIVNAPPFPIRWTLGISIFMIILGVILLVVNGQQMEMGAGIAIVAFGGFFLICAIGVLARRHGAQVGKISNNVQNMLTSNNAKQLWQTAMMGAEDV